MTQAVAGISTNARAAQALLDINAEADRQRAMVASRRGVMGAILALPLAATAAQAQPSGVMALCAEHHRLNAKYRALDLMPGSTDADYDRVADEMAPIQSAIIRTPARSLEEIKAKGQVIRDLYDGDTPDFWSDGSVGQTTDAELVYSILRDLGVM